MKTDSFASQNTTSRVGVDRECNARSGGTKDYLRTSVNTTSKPECRFQSTCHGHVFSCLCGQGNIRRLQIELEAHSC